ncbi:MAG: hypothetical protein H6718_17565 [Polyangiaceae bacterium]|nr:hypothetical protein [Myxococcales bacterium]MCB9587211.1 hypothetical protein [Polyangiaceae bacterium]MCB9609406.1 hypothetical protein [Polyangiaceae bacterium]
MEAWKLLGELAKQRDAAGQRRLAVVVGSGLNVQAGVRDSWLALLERIAAEAQIERAAKERLMQMLSQTGGSGMTSIWEAFLCELANADEAPHQVEHRLQRDVAQLLRETHERKAAELEFFQAFVDLGFADILSLNFDRSLLIATGGEDVSGDGTLSRCGRAGGSRVWYPHGDTKLCRSIRLGVRSYGVYIKELESAYRGYRQMRRDSKGRPSATFSARNWIEAAMRQPLLFVGCGLSTDEWPLWWMLHQRARDQARRPLRLRDPCFVLCAGSLDRISPHLRSGPAGLRLLHAASHRESWQQLAATLTGG